MSTQMITNPPVLDTTGQAIVAALNNLAEATSPTNVYIDIPLSIPVSGWDDNTPHVYTWMNENIVGNCGIEVGFADGAEDVATTFIRVTKIVGGIKFSIDEVPSAPIPLIVRIINAKADSVIGDIDATMVETSAISGVTNVEEALTDLDGRVDDNADDIASNSAAIAKVQNGLAFIVGDTNTTGSTLSVDQFVYVKGHSTISEGLRRVTASISANGNITTSNTSDCSEGGLNTLVEKRYHAVTFNSTYCVGGESLGRCCERNGVVWVGGYFKINQAVPEDTDLIYINDLPQINSPVYIRAYGYDNAVKTRFEYRNDTHAFRTNNSMQTYSSYIYFETTVTLY